MAAQPPPSSLSRRSRTGDKVVGSFTIEDEIGKGSFATVYRGHHKASGALVAIKSVNLSKLNKKLKDNLYCEIEILKGLHHPHIVALIDCKESPTHIHLVMEYCELGDLSFFIKKREKLAKHEATRDMMKKYPAPQSGGLNEVIVRHFLKQLASAMEFLRSRNFIHRDVKPQNLLLLPSPQFLANSKDSPLVMSASKEPLMPMVGLSSLPTLKIADFGFARSLPSTSLAETLCGSPLYMAPEILRYEKYDAKADLWSVGTVLYEMMVGKPPFRASNHVELLRKIEQSEDHIRFPKEAVISSGMIRLIKGLLKRTPVERIPFEDFFHHEVVDEPIPGLMGEDRPREIREPSKSEGTQTIRRPSLRNRERFISEGGEKRAGTPISQSPRHAPASPRPSKEPLRTVPGTSPRMRPPIHALNIKNVSGDHSHTPRPVSPNRNKPPRTVPSPGPSSITQGVLRNRQEPQDDPVTKEERAQAEEAVAFERDYVLVEKRAVEVNAFADEMAANPGLSGPKPLSPRATVGQIVRRATTQCNPASPTGAVPPSASRAVQIASGKQRPDAHQRRDSYERPRYGQSPGSTTSVITKAIQGASLRLFGIHYSPQLIGKGQSPPQLYSPFPSYPTPHGISGLIGDGRPNVPIDEDVKAVHVIEESATRSDVVYGFAEVKYKQLIPLAPSMDHGLGGPVADKSVDSIHDDSGLTVDAIVTLSEEALVLYVKALSLLAKSMDIAGAWWARKNRGEIISSHTSKSDSASSIAAGNRINSAVQWVRSRFNEVLEKAEFVRLKLIEAQKQLPEDHPGHPSNHTSASRLAGEASSSAGGVVLSSGITAEKLMYDRALEMSRSAAINEIANEDLPGCEISYVTAIRMLEAVLENDDEIPQRKSSAGQKEEKENKVEEGATINGINLDDRQAVQKVVAMVRSRLSTLRKKMAIIAKHQYLPHPSSPRPLSMHSGGTTPTVANTPPR